MSDSFFLDEKMCHTKLHFIFGEGMKEAGE